MIAKRKKTSVIAARKKRVKEKAPFPKDIEPMLATLVDKPFDELRLPGIEAREFWGKELI